MSHRRNLILALLLALSTLSAPLAALAEPEPIDLEALAAERADKAKRLSVTERTEKRLNIALERLEEEDYPEAGRELRKLSFRRMNPFERALIARLLAQVAFSQKQPDKAISYFRKALEQEVLSVEDDNALRFNIAQIQIAETQWQPAIDTLREWFRYEAEPNPLGYYLMAIAHYNLQEFDPAITNARRAVELSDEPREGWLVLLVALYSTKEDYAKARPVLEELVTRYPKKQYWVQLSLIYGASDDFQNSLSVQQLAYAQGLLVEDKELQRLARSYLYNEMPYQAAQVLHRSLEEGVIEETPEVLELLGNSWISAREYERALPPLQRAAEISEDGAAYVRLGQVLVQRESWSEAAKQLEKAISKGGLENEGQAKLLLAIALYNDGKVGAARSWFVRASKHDSTRVEGSSWITHLDREAAERERKAAAAAAARPEAQTDVAESAPPS